MTTIDLNCDLGEGFGAWEMGNDAAMIELASSVNVACGFHAGDADIMQAAISRNAALAVDLIERHIRATAENVITYAGHLLDGD